MSPPSLKERRPHTPWWCATTSSRACGASSRVSPTGATTACSRPTRGVVRIRRQFETTHGARVVIFQPRTQTVFVKGMRTWKYDDFLIQLVFCETHGARAFLLDVFLRDDSGVQTFDGSFRGGRCRVLSSLMHFEESVELILEPSCATSSICPFFVLSSHAPARVAHHMNKPHHAVKSFIVVVPRRIGWRSGTR